MITKEDKDQRLEIVGSLNTLKNDLDNEVSDQAFECEQHALINYKETSDELQDKQRKEELFMQYEEELDDQAIKEYQEEE
jgi:hypothetical protein